MDYGGRGRLGSKWLRPVTGRGQGGHLVKSISEANFGRKSVTKILRMAGEGVRVGSKRLRSVTGWGWGSQNW